MGKRPLNGCLSVSDRRDRVTHKTQEPIIPKDSLLSDQSNLE